MAAQVVDAHIEYVANPHSTGSKQTAYSDHDPYVVTLNLQAQPAPSYSYTKVTTLTPGTSYLIAAPISGLQIAQPVAIDKNYEYQPAVTVTDNDGAITLSDNKMAYYIEEDGNGYYYIKDYYGRYLYQQGTYKNTNVGSKSYADASDCKFSITSQPDGTFKILNTTTSYYYYANIYNSAQQFSWCNWTNLGNNQYLPWLYQYNPAAPSAITTVGIATEPVTTRKVLFNGRLTIVTPDGKYYTLQGILHE